MTSPPAELLHQAFQPFPRLDSPMIEPGSGYLTRPWQRLLITLWQKCGGSRTPLPGFVYLTDTGGTLNAWDALTNAPVGTVPIHPDTPRPPQVLVPTSSPFTYTALVPGTLLVFGGQLDLARPGGPQAFYQVSLVGGALPLLAGDRARVTWFGASPPAVTWLPSQ